ncbi:conserved hypothetical protein [Verticillium alfalfae VaMs.102]|uniref:Beta-glucuronidase C-terminal domain-containing protein n=1 Tax=Verticillium alfalfae (strain VaMs.102 / ATCC MYA-4576 / FGSC 10136) TaxID=526221 RepID=C9SEU4_VERA1|nr:conserved hypothetical protein [Verticillium alfalfae VaMs.102]EEY16687.1 conserved hypothetical protein [Verticillium alfalfae VaMs.102]
MAPVLSKLLILGQLGCVSALTFAVPSAVPSNASPKLAAAPVGVSFEFFAWPGYFDDVASTTKCLQNLKDVSGTWPPIRIGGTTQDRATYDASSSAAVTYTVASAGAAPASLTYGPSFFSLAAEYGGKVVIGLNRRLNNQANTIAAAKAAKAAMGNLYSIELGNEPNFFTSSDPIAGGNTWNAAADYASQLSWQKAVGGALGGSDQFSAGVYFGTSPMSIKGLTGQEGSANSFVKDYCSHNYPQSQSTADLSKLMDHSAITDPDSAVCRRNLCCYARQPHIFETILRPKVVAASARRTVQALYFHHGTIGNCQYCWWGNFTVGAPYYGAMMATKALAGADRVAPLDDGSTRYVTAKRLTAAFSTSRVDKGQSPTLAGQTWTGGSCNVKGTEVLETATVSGGKATFTVGASEALLVYL